ncbi:unnamed protein product [Ilex paraguariensis]|uniref:Phosphate transporter n=1 Tax=Ilex paraguariensis TaxID=185542 RepID=A0ABC8RSW6_9AQUA
MSTDDRTTTTTVDLAIRVVGKWKDTYRWIPIFGTIAAIAMAFSAGANNLTAPFSTPIGSGALTFLKASIMACVIYVPGAAFASHSTVNGLFSDFLKEHQPSEGFLMWSLVVVLITATMWLALATYYELPVSSQQSTQGAVLGTMLVNDGFGFMPLWNKNENHNFNGGGLLRIFLEWTVAPLIACFCAFCLFTVMKASLLCHENAEKRILIFLPIYYGIAAGLLCLFIIFQSIKWQVIPVFVTVYSWTAIVAIALATLIGALLTLVVVVPLARQRLDIVRSLQAMKKKNSIDQQCIEIHDTTHSAKANNGEEEFEEALRNFMQRTVLDTVYEEDERSLASTEAIADNEQVQSISQSTTGKSTPFRKLLESTPNRLVQSRNFQKIEKTRRRENANKLFRDIIRSSFFPVIDYDRHTLIRHALAEKFDDLEDFFGFPQLLASCIFALIQSASEVAALVSPIGAILDVFTHRTKYSGNGEDVGSLDVIWWLRAGGGLSASMGFFLCGWRLTQCLGSKLTYISNSRGLVSQFSTVATMIMLSRMNLPVSSVHAFVGSLVGVGIADEPRNVNWRLLLKFLCGWIFTIVFCCAVACGIYAASIHSPAYVVP